MYTWRFYTYIPCLVMGGAIVIGRVGLLWERGVANIQCNRGISDGGGQWTWRSADVSDAKGSSIFCSGTPGSKLTSEGSEDNKPMNSNTPFTGNSCESQYTYTKEWRTRKRKNVDVPLPYMAIWSPLATDD